MVSSWRPRVTPDPENKEDVLLETVGVQEINVMPASPSLIEVFAKPMLINLAFGSRFEPMTEPRFKVMDYRSSSVTLRQGLASPVWLKIHKARLSFGSHARNFLLSYTMRRPEMRSSERNKVHKLAFHPNAGRGVEKPHRQKP